MNIYKTETAVARASKFATDILWNSKSIKLVLKFYHAPLGYNKLIIDFENSTLFIRNWNNIF